MAGSKTYKISITETMRDDHQMEQVERKKRQGMVWQVMPEQDGPRILGLVLLPGDNVHSNTPAAGIPLSLPLAHTQVAAPQIVPCLHLSSVTIECSKSYTGSLTTPASFPQRMQVASCELLVNQN